MKKSVTRTLLAALLLGSASTQAAVLTFDDIGADHGTVLSNQYSGITISADNFTNNVDLAVVFDSSESPTRDSDLEAPFNGDFEPGNIVIIQENDRGCGDGDCNRPDDEGTRFTDGSGNVIAPTGVISFDFDFAIELLSIDFFDVETAENGDNDYNRIDVWDFDTNVITTIGHTPDTGGDNMWAQVVFDSATHPELLNVGRVDVYFGGSGALDNLAYNVVPVPAAVWLFGTALVGLMGYSRRRKTCAGN